MKNFQDFSHTEDNLKLIKAQNNQKEQNIKEYNSTIEKEERDFPELDFKRDFIREKAEEK